MRAGTWEAVYPANVNGATGPYLEGQGRCSVVPQRLQSSSFVVMTYYWLREYSLLNKGTAFEPLSNSQGAKSSELSPLS